VVRAEGVLFDGEGAAQPRFGVSQVSAAGAEVAEGDADFVVGGAQTTLECLKRSFEERGGFVVAFEGDEDSGERGAVCRDCRVVAPERVLADSQGLSGGGLAVGRSAGGVREAADVVRALALRLRGRAGVRRRSGRSSGQGSGERAGVPPGGVRAGARGAPRRSRHAVRRRRRTQVR